MSPKRPASPQNSANAVKSSRAGSWLWRDLLDLLSLLAWGSLLIKYWLTGQLLILLNPNYAWLSHVAAIVLLAMAGFKGGQIWLTRKRPRIAVPQHLTLLPANWSSALLLAVAIFGLIYAPRAFASDTALQRGLADTLPLTRAQPQRFVRQTQPEERTIIDWIRTLNVYPEPDAYVGQAVKVQGFVIHPTDWPDDYMMIARFVLTCCAADAYPVGLPVKLAVSRQAYAVDSWLEIEGTMATETFLESRRLVIQPTQLEAIPTPRSPYEY